MTARRREVSFSDLASSRVKAEIIDFLMENPTKHFHEARISREIEASLAAVCSATKNLLEKKIIKVEDVGRMKFLSLNIQKIEPVIKRWGMSVKKAKKVEALR